MMNINYYLESFNHVVLSLEVYFSFKHIKMYQFTSFDVQCRDAPTRLSAKPQL